jgi:hypothetical protein
MNYKFELMLPEQAGSKYYILLVNSLIKNSQEFNIGQKVSPFIQKLFS